MNIVYSGVTATSQSTEIETTLSVAETPIKALVNLHEYLEIFTIFTTILYLDQEDQNHAFTTTFSKHFLNDWFIYILKQKHSENM